MKMWPKLRTALFGLLMAALFCVLASCAKRPDGPSSKNPDKVLYERAMAAFEQNRFDVARMTFKTLVNTYPNSEWAQQAKLRLKDPRLAKCATFSVPPDCDAETTATQSKP
jgi:outer membrane protein assembly factor BamD (BamD/ComL family)